MSGGLTFRREGAIGILSLDRPDKLNAMTHALGDALVAQVAELAQDDTLRCLILRGEGRAFSAGGDLAFLEENLQRSAAENERDMQDFYMKYLSVGDLPFPTIALLQGRATGAGLCFALGCDMRLAASDAVLSVNFVRLGLTPGMAGTWNLPRLVGPARAAELLYSGRTVNAEEALTMGLVNAVHAPEALLEAGLALARTIAEAAPAAVRETKRMLRDVAGREAALQAEAQAQAVCFASADLREGIQAIRDRRPPEFTGG